MITLDVKLRDVKVNPKMIRKEGDIPAVFYGAGKESTPITIEKKRFIKVFEEAGESTVITLKTPSGELTALIHDVDLDPVFGTPIHADFYIVAKDRKVEVPVPLTFTGVAPAEKLGGVTVKVLHEITVEALPANLPHDITVDLTQLTAMDSVITVADLKLGNGVAVVGHQGDEVIAAVTAQAADEPVAAPLDLSKIEVEKKGKKEEEAEGDK